jgi:hypothetical protein
MSVDGFDLEGTPDNPQLQDCSEELKKQVFYYEKVLREQGMDDLIVSGGISDEEYICLKGIADIKLLVNNSSFTKDDINMFDVLYRNLNVIRGIKLSNVKKEKPKSRDELLKIVKKA